MAIVLMASAPAARADAVIPSANAAQQRVMFLRVQSYSASQGKSGGATQSCMYPSAVVQPELESQSVARRAADAFLVGHGRAFGPAEPGREFVHLRSEIDMLGMTHRKRSAKCAVAADCGRHAA